jgi:hypothetical protein
MSITISDTEPRVQYTATSGQTSFTVGFEFFDNADLKVFNGTSLLTFSASPADATEYSVSGAGQTGGGSITLGSPGATVNDVITISRDLAIARSTDFPTSGAFQIGSLNTELDKIIAMCQQLERDLKFSPKAAATTANTFDITFPNLVANKVLSVNSSGNGLEFSQDITNINTIAAIASDVTTVSNIAADVSTVANNVSPISTVSTNIASVNTVATNISKVIEVANDLQEAVSEIETVALDLQEATPEIDTVANNIVNVNNVGNDIANVNLAGNNIGNINTVAGQITPTNNIATLAGLNTEITTTAGLSSEITTVSGLNTQITGVYNISTEITSVNSNSGNINTVATDLAGSNTIGAVATDLSGSNNIGTVATNIASVQDVSSNIGSVNDFAARYRISATAPSTSLDIGDLYFDTTVNELKVYKSSGWAAAGSTVNGTSQRFTYNITGTPTTVSGADANGNTLAYDAGFADIYVNGVRMSSADITITSGTSVVFASALANGDVVDVVAYGTFNVASIDAANIDSGTLNNARLTGSGAITINGSSVALGGNITVGETKPTISSISPSTITNSQTSITITGTNFVSVPQVEALNQSTGIWYTADTISFTNATTLVATFTLSVDAQYKLRIENPDGNAVLSSSNILTVSDAPTWSTSAGSLGTFQGNFSGTLATISASSDSTVAYSETTSVLTGAGVTLNTSTGALTTTDFGASSTTPTTYNFTIRATDGEGQTTDRSFSMTSNFGATGGGQFN